jgi:hypothetical protein
VVVMMAQDGMEPTERMDERGPGATRCTPGSAVIGTQAVIEPFVSQGPNKPPWDAVTLPLQTCRRQTVQDDGHDLVGFATGLAPP